MWVYFPDDILTDWRRQPKDSKDAMVDVLHWEFPNPEGYHFKYDRMVALMNHVLKSRQGTARTAVNTESPKPAKILGDDWRRVLDERQSLPNHWDQLREANCSE